MSEPCKWFTLKRSGDDFGGEGYLHKAMILASPLIFWTTPQDNSVCHAPKRNITGIKTYLEDPQVSVVPCPCIGDGLLSDSDSENQKETLFSSKLLDSAFDTSGIESKKALELLEDNSEDTDNELVLEDD